MDRAMATGHHIGSLSGGRMTVLEMTSEHQLGLLQGNIAGSEQSETPEIKAVKKKRRSTRHKAKSKKTKRKAKGKKTRRKAS